MKKYALFAGFAVLFLFACGDSGPEVKLNTTEPANTAAPSYPVAGLHLQLNANPAWQYENLRLYPVVLASDRQTAEGVGLPLLKTLSEAMNLPGFRITERKQFGNDPGAWYNALTVQNKTDETIFLMAGDVVTGGNQDRVIAHDDVVLPRTVKNIEVFCVEHGRSSYYNPAAPESEKKVAAFRGYYSVASPQVRKAVHSGNQQGVWDAVSAVTAVNDAKSGTGTYAALETENEKKARREAYLRFFDGKFDDMPNTVGIVAVCNGKVVGIDIFGQPDLFRRQFKALLHGYATEAAAAEPVSNMPEPNVEYAFHDVASLAGPDKHGSELAGKFDLEGRWVHLFKK
ncbi:MAG: hypothetical protein L6Q97_00575 [Thermoanaerobaculia bacterium]|nr:hypothetical protein [Thermoanaerobaculia bacterium]